MMIIMTTTDDDDEDDDVRRKCKWNQSTVAILHRDDKFIRSIKLSRRILFMRNDIGIDTTSTSSTCTPNVVGEMMLMTPRQRENDEELIKPPTNEPHFSFAYSEFSLGHSVQDFPPDFDSTELVLFRTDPTTLDIHYRTLEYLYLLF